MDSNILKTQLKKFTYSVFCIHFLIFILIFIFTIFYNNKVKNEISSIAFSSIKNDVMIGDIRKVAYVLNPVAQNYFINISLRKEKTEIIFPIGNSSIENNTTFQLHSKIIYDIFYDENSTIKMGDITFTFNRFEFLFESVILWSFMVLISIPLLLKERKKIIDEFNKNLSIQKNLYLSEMAKQVSHDIRSPLAALNMAIRDISNIPEEKRIIIRGSVSRIQDIANDLLAKNRDSKKSEKKSTLGSKEYLNTQLMSSLLDDIVTEKRMQFRSKLSIEIEFCSGTNSYGLFAKIQPHGFKRVISNIVNNSVEALGDIGKVQIELSGSHEKIKIKIKDNGKGIPPEVLKKLGHQGETHGKEGGNGLGLYHAKKSVESWNGDLSIDSEVGNGTTLTITLPKSDVPSWFVPELKLVKNGNIVVLDDDSTIHQIWKGRFEEVNLSDSNISVFHFSTAEQVENWIENHNSTSEVVYLFDFELIGQKTNGLKLIEKLDLAKQAILVTSRYEEKNILEKCQTLGVKLIPKSMAESVPISINPSLNETATDSLPVATPLYDVVYVDDDKYLRMGWEKSAKVKGIKLLTLSSTKEFEKYSIQLSNDVTFYIDRELGENEPKGEVWAKELFEKGYRNLYLATGYSADYFPSMEWVSGITSKVAPWEEKSEDW